jgi:hypothetical protein
MGQQEDVCRVRGMAMVGVGAFEELRPGEGEVVLDHCDGHPVSICRSVPGFMKANEALTLPGTEARGP